MTTIAKMNHCACSHEGSCEIHNSLSISGETRTTLSYRSHTSQVDAVTPAVPASPHKSSPTRGVKKVPSLRRGAAGFSQLLQSAVLASIEAKQDGAGSSDSFGIEASTELSTEPLDLSGLDLSGNSLCDNDRRGQKKKRESMDAAPSMPRRIHSRRENLVGSSSVLSHHDGDDSDSNSMDIS